MTAKLRSMWQSIVGRSQPTAEIVTAAPQPAPPIVTPAVDIAPNDPLMAYVQSTSGPIEIDKLTLDSPAVQALREAGVKLTIPLVSQGELMGLINLGPRLSEQEYSTDDRRLLGDLATQSAPAVRVAQLVRQQQAEIKERERIEQELRVATLIQQTLLPKDVPDLPGWQVAAYYQPAREVGGDFYEFLTFPDGRMGFVVADVTDKGVPAALVMATTRSILRASAERLMSPSVVLERVNDILHPDIPPKMFVTCFYALLDPATGRLKYANAGHDLPYCRRVGQSENVDELRARGMPLGLMPGMTYEEKETVLAPGESLLLYSDGLVEAHNPQRDMFGFPRLQQLMADHPGGEALIAYLLGELETFTGADWEQEDDVTLVVLERDALPDETPELKSSPQETGQTNDNHQVVLAEFTVASEPGNERLAADQIAQALTEAGIHLPARRLERLKTAVAEATMNAMEHGNHYQADVPVVVQLLTAEAGSAIAIRIIDEGGGQQTAIPDAPDLDAKLAGSQSPRGWGLFLIQNMVDEMKLSSDETHHTIELILHLEGDDHGRETP